MRIRIKASQLKTLSVALAICLSGCVTTERDWQVASRINTVQSYKGFLDTHPQSTFTVQASSRIVAIQDWESAQSMNTIAAYQKFTQNHPADPHFLQAKRTLERLEAARDWIPTCKTNTAQAYIRFMEQHPDSEFKKEATTSLLNLLAETDWNAMVAQDSESGWLKYIVQYWSSPRINAAIANFARHEAKRLQTCLKISSIKPNMSPGMLVVTADISVVAGSTPVRYKCLTSASVYDKISNGIKLDVSETQFQRAERGRLSDFEIIRPGSTNMFVGMAGASPAWPGSRQYQGRGIVLMFACAAEESVKTIENRISNLIIIDANFKEGTAVVLLPSETTKSAK